MTTERELFVEIGSTFVDAEQSQMFGKPSFTIDRRAFVCFFQDEMVFKLGADAHHDALSLEGSQLFDPSGKNRPMKEWVQVPFTHQHRWEEFALSAMNYVRKASKP